jgi:hypothetical protein
MEAGTTFLRADADAHLWIVLSSPSVDKENVLIVNLTSFGPRQEDACILDRGEHPFITHKTCVNYGDSQITTLEKLHAAKDGGAIRLRESLTPAVLKKVVHGVLVSERMKLDHANILFMPGQALEDC